MLALILGFKLVKAFGFNYNIRQMYSSTALLMLLFFNIYDIDDNFNGFLHIIDTCKFMTTM